MCLLLHVTVSLTTAGGTAGPPASAGSQLWTLTPVAREGGQDSSRGLRTPACLRWDVQPNPGRHMGEKPETQQKS